MSILYFLITIIVIVMVHEVGHFLVAKLFKVYCKEFSLGFGPKVLSFKGKETLYSLRLLPLGGYVSMAGEEGVDIANIDPSRTINGVNKIKRVLIMLAGVFMNFLLALVLFCSVYLIQPKEMIPPPAIINVVVENSPAADAGFKSGDLVVSVTTTDGLTVKPKDFFELQTVLQGADKPLKFVLARDNKNVEVTVTPVYNEELKRTYIGISAKDPTYRTLNFTQSLTKGFNTMVDSTKGIGSFFVELFRGKGLNELGGPVGIFTVTNKYAEAGIVPFIYLIAMLSLNVGFFNLLPLPVLDGGRVVLVIIEALINKPINKKIETGLMITSALLLVALIIFASYNDIARMFVK